ncbi:MAG: hypothetical protein J6X60_02110 [Ruminiclostridium sp.]|nr:hypothetical protein [Ruminiclostridium sp.]
MELNEILLIVAYVLLLVAFFAALIVFEILVRKHRKKARSFRKDPEVIPEARRAESSSLIGRHISFLEYGQEPA